MTANTSSVRARGTSARDRSSSDRLLEAAERLIGTHGLDGVSLRQIQIAAGSSNNFAVQYHFKDVGGLVEAILARRMPEVDARQAELLGQLETIGRQMDIYALVNAFFRPLLEQVDAKGERSYARFICALLRSPEGDRHCAVLFHLTPTTGRILSLLRVANPQVPLGLLEERLRLLSGMVCTSVFNRLPPRAGAEQDSELIDDALNIAAAGLMAPVRAIH